VSITAFFISLLLLCAREAGAFQIVEGRPVAEVRAEMQMPTDAAFAESGALYVLDGYQNRIVVRDPRGRIRILSPKAPCALNRPLGITAHGGNIYVADTGNRRVCELDEEGRCLRTITLTGRDTKTPFVPSDIAIEGARRVVVVDRGSSRIHLCPYPSFDPDETFGDWGKSGGVLNNPYLVAIRQGNIFLTDMMNGRLVQVTTEGVFLKDLGERGVREGQFVRPKGVAAGVRGRVFVSDSTLGVVQVFDTEFRYRGTVGTGGSPRRFQHPAGLAAYQNLLAVVEQRGNVVTVLVLLSLMTAAFVPTSQNLGEIYGQKKLFTLGLAFFGISMLIIIASPNLAVLVVGYSIIGGLAATPLVTVPWIIMNRLFEGWQKDVALLSLSTAAVAGSLTGPFVGGYIATASDWRWAFAPQLVVVIIIWVLIQPVTETERRRDVTIDWMGGLLSFLGLAAVLVGITLAAEYGWWTPKKVIRIGSLIIPPFGLSITPILMATGAVLLTIFAFYWRRQTNKGDKASVWRVGLLRRRDFVTGLITSALYAIAAAGLTFTLYLFLQTALNLTSFDTSLSVLPFNIVMIVVMLATFQLGWRIVPKYIIQVGLVILGFGLWLLYNALAPGISPLQLAPGLIVAGIGGGLIVGSEIPDDAKLENLKAMCDTCKKHGVYRK